MSFLGGLFTGSNGTETGDVNNAGNVAGFGIASGEGDINAASGFDQALLSGNQSQIAKLLAPQIQAIQQQGQQQNQTAAQFGNRSGGTNAGAQSNIDSQRANVSNMVSQLTSGAAGQLGQLGTSTLGLGLSANQQQDQEAQQIMENQRGSILGGAITGGVSAGLDAATGGLTGMAGGESAGAGAGQLWAPNASVQAGNAFSTASDDNLGDVGF